MSSSQSFLNMLCHAINCHWQAIQHLRNHLPEKVCPYHLVICDAPFGKGAHYTAALYPQIEQGTNSLQIKAYIFLGVMPIFQLSVFSQRDIQFFICSLHSKDGTFQRLLFGKRGLDFLFKEAYKMWTLRTFFKRLPTKIEGSDSSHLQECIPSSTIRFS